MTEIQTNEYGRSAAVTLTFEQIAWLRGLEAPLTIEPSGDGPDRYTVAAGCVVGVASGPGVRLSIRPKIELSSLVFLLSYALDPKQWRDLCSSLSPSQSLVEAVALILARLVHSATARGLLHGYRSTEDWSATLRGRLRVDDLIRRGFGRVPPVPVRYDDYTANIPENEVLLLALRRLAGFPLRSPRVRQLVGRALGAFAELDRPTLDPSRPPEILFNRLNAHYEPAVRLALLVLRCSGAEVASRGSVGLSFLIDMNRVFEAFVHRALAEELGVPGREFRKNDGRLWLDEGSAVRLEPDLTWWRGDRCVFVGDAKYKDLDRAGVVHGDLYQLLAYVVSAGVGSGTLIYASGADEPRRMTVRGLPKSLIVRSVNLRLAPERLLEVMGGIAAEIRESAALCEAAAASPRARFVGQ